MSAGPSGAGTEARAPVSVVVPCYRVQDTLARALRSVTAQTLQPLEVIAVDDASDDGTWEELNRLQAELGTEFLRILRLPNNAGASAARNAGWDLARGDLVAFLDADDAWHPRKLELQYELMRSRPELSLTGHGFQLHGTPMPDIEPVPDLATVTARALLWKNRFVTPSVMLRRALPVRFNRAQRHMEDHRLWMDIAFAGYRIGFIDAPLAVLFKPAFVHSGLSSSLWAMESAELSNYRDLRAAGQIGGVMCAMLQAWSAVRFLRRIGIVCLYRLRQAAQGRLAE